MSVCSPASKTLRQLNLSAVKFAVSAVRQTTEWAHATHGHRASYPEYLSRDIHPTLKDETYSRLQIPNIHLVTTPTPDSDLLRLAIPNAIITAILNNLDPRVNLDDPVFQDGDIASLPGYTVFSAWLGWHGLTREGEEYDGSVDLRASHGGEIARGELAAGARVTADFKPTLAYRGPTVDPAKWDQVQMSLKLGARAIWLQK